MNIICRCGKQIVEPLPGSPNVWPCLSCGRVGLVLSDGDTVMWLRTEDELGLNLRDAIRGSRFSQRMGDNFG